MSGAATDTDKAYYRFQLPPPVYQTAKDSNDLNTSPQPEELAIVTKQLAAGASELRDEIVDPWTQSTQIVIGFPLVRVSDIESGTVPMTTSALVSD